MQIKRKIVRVKQSARSNWVIFDRLLSRTFIGSNAGLYRYVAGEAGVRFAQWKAGTKSNGGWERGYVLLGQFYPATLMNDIAADFDRLINTDGAYFRRGNQNRIHKETGTEFTRQLNDAPAQMPLARQLASEELKREVGSYFGTNCELVAIYAWRNSHVPKEYAHRDLLSDHWHQDSTTSDIVKVFVTLQDVSPKDGPFHFIPRPQSRRAMLDHRFQRVDAELPPGISFGDVHKLTGPIGTAAIVNTIHCLHKAGIPLKGHSRDMVEIRFRAVA